jgi:hypothetical protein
MENEIETRFEQDFKKIGPRQIAGYQIGASDISRLSDQLAIRQRQPAQSGHSVGETPGEARTQKTIRAGDENTHQAFTTR